MSRPSYEACTTISQRRHRHRHRHRCPSLPYQPVRCQLDSGLVTLRLQLTISTDQPRLYLVRPSAHRPLTFRKSALTFYLPSSTRTRPSAQLLPTSWFSNLMARRYASTRLAFPTHQRLLLPTTSLDSYVSGTLRTCSASMATAFPSSTGSASTRSASVSRSMRGTRSGCSGVIGRYVCCCCEPYLCGLPCLAVHRRGTRTIPLRRCVLGTVL